MDVLITTLTLLVAFYTIIPRERQLELRLQLDIANWLAISLGILGILYLEFYEFFLARGWVFSRPWPRGIDARNTMYLVMVVVIVFVGLRLRFWIRLTRRNIRKFQELIEELYWTESYGALLSLLRRHLQHLTTIYCSDSFLTRMRNRLDLQRPPRFEDTIELLSGPNIAAIPPRPVTMKSNSGRQFLALVAPVASRVARLLPDSESERQVARDIIQSVVLSPRFVAALARTRPYFGLDVIRRFEGSRERYSFDFIDLYLRQLIENPESIFYTELFNNQNCGAYRYFIPTSNRLLNFLFSDITVAQQNGVYKPIGDYILSYLHNLARDHESDPYNRAMGDFAKIGAWRSPLFTAIRFFDIMVKEALFQKIEWHMWLYYMPDFVKGIVQNYRLADPLADADAEWPVRYSFLLYEIFSSMCDWVRALEEIPKDQANVILGSVSTRHENGNIPKSSILALAQCSRHILLAEHVGLRLKHYLMDMVFRLYFDLRELGFDRYAEVVSKATCAGGFHKPNRDEKYSRALLSAFEAEETEYTIKYDEIQVSELKSALTGSSPASFAC